jgi:DNA-binding winged helix-turn-helix (wHTH) protein
MEKADLIKAVWPDTHVEEANLAQTVSVVRKALGNAPGGCLYVETVPKRGYRMAVEVRRIACDAETMPVAPKTGRALRMKSVLSIGALVGAALVCLILYRTLTGQ